MTIDIKSILARADEVMGLAKSATKEPWHVYATIREVKQIHSINGAILFETTHHGAMGADASFVAEARSLVPQLAADVRELVGWIEKLEENHPETWIGVQMYANADVACKAALERAEKAEARLAIAVEALTPFAEAHQSGKWCVKDCSCRGDIARAALAKIADMSHPSVGEVKP